MKPWEDFNINCLGIIKRWERIYLEEGPEGLAVERRGRKNTGQPAKLPKEIEEDLIAENQRLRAENAYLKNLQALVWKRSDAGAEIAGSSKLRHDFSLSLLLSIAQLPRATFLLSFEANGKI